MFREGKYEHRCEEEEDEEEEFEQTVDVDQFRISSEMSEEQLEDAQLLEVSLSDF